MEFQDCPEMKPSHTPDSPPRGCALYKMGRVSYADALEFQHQLHSECVAGHLFGALILLEHDPVITMGVKTGEGNVLASPQSLEAQGVELYETDRGGDVTYHGPGQLVGYPILKLREVADDLHGYLRRLEQTVIDTLAVFGIEGRRNPPAGVWVADKKICSIGIAVRRWVTYHGFALNVDPNMAHFALINPCGLSSARMTSMAGLLGGSPGLDRVQEVYASKFAEVFGVNLYTPTKPLC